MKTLARYQTAPLLLIFMSVGACHKDSVTTTTTAASVSTASAVKPPPIPDADILKVIERHMRDEDMAAAHVSVAVADGIVSLSGAATSILAKERAVAIAETIKGVRSVVDEIKVTPDAISDEQLSKDVKTAFSKDLATRSHEIGVSAKDGVVTLVGVADSWQQRDLFREIAKGVRGVKELTSNVVVHFMSQRAPAEVLADVKNRLANDAWLDASLIQVDLDGNTVALSGIVGSAAQRTRAKEDAGVEGIDKVDDSKLFVDWVAAADGRRTTGYPLKTDADISKAVHDAFIVDPRLKNLMPEIVVQKGTVTLSGIVDSAQARRAAERDATNTLGVWAVHDNVLIQQAGRPADVDIERDAKQILTEDFFVPDAKTITVSSVKGKVTLTGTVTTGLERYDVMHDLKDIPGISDVDDKLVVKRSALDIQLEIENRLYWDPMVERDHVTVAVAPDGVATLTGTLDTWGEIKAASNAALRGGASHVVNLLKLKNHPEFAVAQ